MNVAGKGLEKIVRVQEELVKILVEEREAPIEKLYELVSRRVGEVSREDFVRALEELERGYVVERRRVSCREYVSYKLV